MARTTIRIDTDGMRTFAPLTEEPDGSIAGAADALETALDYLAAGADGFRVPGRDALDFARQHHDRCRTLAEEFELVVERFHKSQLRDPLPILYSRTARPDHLGPVGDLNDGRNRRWLDGKLREAGRLARTAHSRRVASGLRRQLGLATAPRVRVASQELLMSASVVGVVGAEAGVVWVIDEFSDSSAEVTLRYLHATSVQTGIGGEAQLYGGGLPLGPDAMTFGARGLAGFALAAPAARSWTRWFPSRAAAGDFVGEHRLEALVDRGADLVPLFGGLVSGWVDPGGMQASAVRERARGVVASAELAGALHPFDLGEGGAELAIEAEGGIMFSQRSDERTGIRTDVVLLQGSIVGSASFLGTSSSPARFGSTTVAVSRDHQGRPIALTVTTVRDDKPGGRPPGVPAAAERRPAEPGDESHLYELEVVVDLHDPRNAALATSAGSGEGGSGAVDARRAVELASAVDDTVRARSRVTFSELAVGGTDGVELAVEQAKGMSLAVGAEVVSQERRMVAVWTGPGDRLRQVVGR